jgi:RNA polymerase sigma factor (sigma-70 family)
MNSLEMFRKNADLAKLVSSRWRRYSTPTCDLDDINQEALIDVWRGSSDGKGRGYAANSAANAARNAIRDDQRARNPSLGHGKRIRSSAFVYTSVHDDAICGDGVSTVEDCLESASRGDLDLAIDILSAVAKLPPKLRSVIERRYTDGTDQDQADLARTDGVSRQRIAQLEQKAMAKLRRLLK